MHGVALRVNLRTDSPRFLVLILGRNPDTFPDPSKNGRDGQ